MNVAFLLKKTPIVFLLFLCFVISFNYAEAERAIRVRKVKTISPRHITLSVRSGNGIYARKYAHGRPLISYSTKGIVGNNRRYYSTRNVAGRRRSLSRNYAARYRNWTPNQNFPGGGKNNPRVDKLSQQKKRKGLYPFLKEPPLGGNQKRRQRPNRLNAMQKPRPPKMPNEFDEDYFFPEEAKRAETRYEFETRFPRPKKKRRPEIEENFKKPDFSKIPFYDEKPLPYKTKNRDPAFSYSSFIQHPSSFETEDIYEDPDNFYSQPVFRNKKKRVKKKSNSRKKNKDRYKPIVFESDASDENYPPYQDQFELPTKTYKKRNKPNYDSSDENDFVPQTSSVYSKPKPQNNLFSTDSDYRGSQNTQQVSQFSPSYSQTWSNVVETTARPVQYQTENGFQPQTYIPNQQQQYNNYNKDYSTVQKVKTVTNTQQSTYYSQPDNSYKSVPFNDYNYVNTKAPTTQTQTPNNYNSYSNSVYTNQQTYSQPVPSSSSTLTDVTIQKSVPVYDNTETFYNFNNNAYINSQSSKFYSSDASKYYDQDNSYGTRTSYRNKLGEKTDSDNEFIKKHQNLYNNGLAGIPIQGDGYAKESGKKDYDIGYGDFQFDENPTT